MGLRGPAPTPTLILAARDSRHARGRAGEVQFGAPESLDPPAWLKGEARREWKRIAPILAAAGLLQDADLSMLAAYCEAHGEFVEACRRIEDEGRTFTTQTGYQAESPWVRIKNSAAERMTKLAQQFGFSPASRPRVKAPAAPEAAPSGKARFFKD